jgi:hypothetical protein
MSRDIGSGRRALPDDGLAGVERMFDSAETYSLGPGLEVKRAVVMDEPDRPPYQHPLFREQSGGTLQPRRHYLRIRCRGA